MHVAIYKRLGPYLTGNTLRLRCSDSGLRVQQRKEQKARSVRVPPAGERHRKFHCVWGHPENSDLTACVIAAYATW
jgi:hypothetical protein